MTPPQPPSSTPTLLTYARAHLGYEKINADEHGHLIRMLERNAEYVLNPTEGQPQRIILILLPRNTYKTTLASITFPMWMLERDPNFSCLIDSETYNLSKSILSEIKQQYENEEFHNPVQRKNTTRWSEDSIIVPGRDRAKKEGSINAAGIDGVKAGMHYPLIIADDLHSQNNTKTPQQIQDVSDHIKLMLSILSPGGLLVVIGTRWAASDAYDMVMQIADETLIIPAISDVAMNLNSTPIISEVPQFCYNSNTKAVDEATSFYLNFPHTLNLQHLSKIQSRQDIYIYSAQYLLHPVASREKRFRDEWLRFYKTDSPPAENIPPLSPNNPNGYAPDAPPSLLSDQFRRLIIVDPAFTTTAYSDFTGVIVLAVNSLRHVYVAHAEQVKLEPFSLLEYLFDMCERWKTNDTFIEEVAAQKVLIHFMEYMSSHKNKSVSITPVKSFGRKKDLRIMSLQPYFRAGLIWLHESQADLLQQIKKYPILKHDDLIDTLAYAPQIVYDGVNVKPEDVKHEGVTFDELIKARGERKAVGIRPMNWGE